MPRDKTESHIRIIEAAKKEFNEYGYMDASLRRIATEAGIQVSGLYKHFGNKEKMFESLVEPAIDGFYSIFRKIEGDYFSEIDEIDESFDWQGQCEATQVMGYIYDHIDEFDLIINKSQGTKYEGFIHEVAELEEEVTLRYMRSLKKAGAPVKSINRKEFHLLVSAYIDAIFQPIRHGFKKKEAIHYARTMEEFFKPAWKAWFGI